MKTLSFKLALMAILLVSVTSFVVNCSKNPTDADKVSDAEAIKELLGKEMSKEDPDLYSFDGMNDDGEQWPEYDLDLAKSLAPIYPDSIKFGRSGQFRLESVDVKFPTDTTAIATIYHSFNGTFFILAKDTTDPRSASKLYKKEMTNTLVRKVKMLKFQHTRFPRLNWKVVEVSMGKAYSSAPTIQIQEMIIDLPDTAQDLVITEPLEYFMERWEGFPTFSLGDTVKIYVRLTNSNNYPPAPGTTVLLHWGANRQLGRRARRPFNDQGLYPDKVAGDGIFSGCWVIKHRRGLFHAVADAIDHGTIYDDAAPYNSTSWGIPYKVK